MTALAASHHPSTDANTGEDAKQPLRDDIQQARFGLRSHIDFLEKLGTDFQRWLGKFAGDAFPGGFVQIRPYGKRGDRNATDGGRAFEQRSSITYLGL